MTYIREGNKLLAYFLAEPEDVRIITVEKPNEIAVVITLEALPPIVFPFRGPEDLKWFIGELQRIAAEIWPAEDDAAVSEASGGIAGSAPTKGKTQWT